MAEKVILAPHSIEAEIQVLGSIIFNDKSMDLIADRIKPEAFYKLAHAQIYKKMMALYLIGKPIDIITLTDAFTKNQMDSIGVFYLSEIMDTIVSSANITYHAQIVIDKWRERTIRVKCMEIVVEIDNGNAPDDLEAQLLSLFQSFDKAGGYKKVETFIPIVDENINRLAETKGVVKGIRTGLTDLDKLSGGMQPSDLIVLAGRPSMGKTSLAVTIANNISREGYKAAIASIESTATQLTERLVLQEADVDSHKYQAGYISADEVQSLKTASGVISGLPIWVDDSVGMDMMDIHSRARRLKASQGLDLLIIDYLQRMTSGGQRGMTKNDITGMYTKQAKNIAKDLDITVILLSQLSRDTEKRHGRHKRPILSDLRDSGEIEAEADLVWLLYRPEFYGIHVDKDNNSLDGMAEIIQAKNRNGRTGTVKVMFDKPRMKFKDLANDWYVDDLPF